MSVGKEENQVRSTSRPEFQPTESDSERWIARIVGAAATRYVEDTDPVVGTDIGPFTVRERLGEGGMSVVYLATQKDDVFDRLVCLKLIKRGMDTDAVLRRFQHERRILAALDHPNIARLYDGGTTPDGRPYFVMEYVDGQHLLGYCDAHGLSLNQRIDLFRVVCDAVQFAHQNLVVHRDLKPANIIVTSSGVPKLLDFGIAAVLQPDSGTTSETTEPLGSRAFLTPAYASPEQVRGQRVTTATDVYSLSTILYRLLSGAHPFPAESRAELEEKIQKDLPAPPSRHRAATAPRLHGDLDRIVLKGMAKDPAERYATPLELSADLARYRQGMPIQARPNSRTERFFKLIRRNKLATAAVLLLTTLAVSATVQSFRLESARQSAHTERDRAQETAALLADVLDVADPNVSFRESPHSPLLDWGGGSFTLEAWIQCSSGGQGLTTILDKRVPPYLASRGFSLFLYEGRLGLQIADGEKKSLPGQQQASTSNNYLGTTDVSDGRWHHVVASARRNEGSEKDGWIGLFVDGRLDREFGGEVVRSGSTDNTAPVRVGLESDGFHISNPFRGAIREVAIYDQALTPAEVATRHRLGQRELHSQGAYVSPVSGLPGETIQTALVVTNPGGAERTLQWTVAGLIGPGQSRPTIPTRFSPVSGTLHIFPGQNEGVQGFAIELPDDLPAGPTRFVVSLQDGASSEPWRVYGVVHVHARETDRGQGQSQTQDPTSPKSSDRLSFQGASSNPLRDSPPSGLRVPAPLDLSFGTRLRTNERFSRGAIHFGVSSRQPIEVELEIRDISGQVVRNVPLGPLSAGQHSVQWDGTGPTGERLKNGIYTIRILGRDHLVAQWDESAGGLRRAPAELLQQRVVHLRHSGP